MATDTNTDISDDFSREDLLLFLTMASFSESQKKHCYRWPFLDEPGLIKMNDRLDIQNIYIHACHRLNSCQLADSPRSLRR